jgi:hypothetical protein
MAHVFNVISPPGLILWGRRGKKSPDGRGLAGYFLLKGKAEPCKKTFAWR